MEGRLIIFSAPSGAGKTTIVRHLIRVFPQLSFSVSATTRARRPGEVDGQDYYFLSMDEFRNKISNEEFIEFEEVYEGAFYGTLRKELERIWAEGKHVIFDVDVEGGVRLKELFRDRALAVFVQAPSVETIIERLTARGTETEESRKKRIEKVAKELLYIERFDKVLVNDRLERAFEEAERLVKDFLRI